MQCVWDSFQEGREEGHGGSRQQQRRRRPRSSSSHGHATVHDESRVVGSATEDDVLFFSLRQRIPVHGRRRRRSARLGGHCRQRWNAIPVVAVQRGGPA